MEFQRAALAPVSGPRFHSYFIQYQANVKMTAERLEIVYLTSIRRMCSEIGIPLVTRQVYDIVFGPKLLPILIINSKNFEDK
jgi:hypothetical protein